MIVAWAVRYLLSFTTAHAFRTLADLTVHIVQKKQIIKSFLKRRKKCENIFYCQGLRRLSFCAS